MSSEPVQPALGLDPPARSTLLHACWVALRARHKYGQYCSTVVSRAELDAAMEDLTVALRAAGFYVNNEGVLVVPETVEWLKPKGTK